MRLCYTVLGTAGKHAVRQSTLHFVKNALFITLIKLREMVEEEC